MFCANCGSEISENTKFCSHCGKPIITDATMQQMITFHTVEECNAWLKEQDVTISTIHFDLKKRLGWMGSAPAFSSVTMKYYEDLSHPNLKYAIATFPYTFYFRESHASVKDLLQKKNPNKKIIHHQCEVIVTKRRDLLSDLIDFGEKVSKEFHGVLYLHHIDDDSQLIAVTKEMIHEQNKIDRKVKRELFKNLKK